MGNDFTLAKRISILLTLGGSPYVLILVSGIVGGLAAGISAIFGRQLSLLFKKGIKLFINSLTSKIIFIYSAVTDGNLKLIYHKI